MKFVPEDFTDYFDGFNNNSAELFAGGKTRNDVWSACSESFVTLQRRL